ncbi:hypothetical protein MMC13_004606 [Lambiella insularis]|nr:hypothetical protein [Lambiella insularis]
MHRQGFGNPVYSSSSRGVEIVANIIFVHGLFGHPQKTWTTQLPKSSDNISHQSSTEVASSTNPKSAADQAAASAKRDSRMIFWPADLLPSVLPDVRIFTWGYDADIHHWASSTSQNNVHQHAGNLLGDLADLMAKGLSEPLIFVVHGLGGIIVKDALNQSSHTEITRRKIVAPATYGIVFLGTPHRGSRSASIVKLAFNVTVAATRRPNIGLLSTLRKDSEILDRIGDSFLQTLLKFRYQIYSFREEKETRKFLIINTMVVDAYSAKIGVGQEETGSIPGNHSEMTKYATASDIGFERVSAQLHRWVEEIKASRTGT